LAFDWIGRLSRIGASRVLVWFVCAGAFAQQSLQVENAASLLTGDIAAGSLVRLQLVFQSGGIEPHRSVDGIGSAFSDGLSVSLALTYSGSS
jgi:hypothetical protein